MGDTSHAGDVEHVQIRPPKHNACEIFYWEVKRAVDAPVRRVAYQLSRDHLRVPNITFLVDGGPIRTAGMAPQIDDDALVGNCAGLNVIVAGEDVFPSFRKVEQSVVRAPTRHVEADDAAVQLYERVIGIKAVQSCHAACLLLVHPANEKTAATIDFAVI